jgi:hypothetical protein
MHKSSEQFPISHVKPIDSAKEYGWEAEEREGNMGVKFDSNYKTDHQRTFEAYKKLQKTSKENGKARAEGKVNVVKIRSDK